MAGDDWFNEEEEGPPGLEGSPPPGMRREAPRMANPDTPRGDRLVKATFVDRHYRLIMGLMIGVPVLVVISLFGLIVARMPTEEELAQLRAEQKQARSTPAIEQSPWHDDNRWAGNWEHSFNVVNADGPGERMDVYYAAKANQLITGTGARDIRPVIHASCDANITGVRFSAGIPMVTHQMHARIDGAAALPIEVEPNGPGVVRLKSPIPFLKRIDGAETLSLDVELEEFGAVTLDFDIDDAAFVVQSIRGNCHW